jgi:hypothetical protein
MHDAGFDSDAISRREALLRASAFSSALYARPWKCRSG